MKFLLLQTLRLASQATSLYTREAHYRPTAHLKGVTHYTLQGKACEKEYEQMPVLLLFFRQVKPALWKAPLRESSFYLIIKKHNFLSRFFFDHVGAKRKAHFATQSCKKKAPYGEFRCLRVTTRATRPRPRRLPQKAGENFHSILTKDSGLCSAPPIFVHFWSMERDFQRSFLRPLQKIKSAMQKIRSFCGARML